MNLTTQELLAMAVAIVKHIEEWRSATIHLDNDDLWYQKIWQEDRNLDLDNPEWTVGYLDEDILALKKIVKGKAEPNHIDIQRLGQLFTTIGATMNKKYKP